MERKELIQLKMAINNGTQSGLELLTSKRLIPFVGPLQG